MKCKKLLALVMAAVLSVSMLTACGGGSNGVSGSLDQNEVNSLLKNNAGSNAQIVKDGDLDDAVKAGAAQIVSTGNANSASAVVANEMGWDFVSVASQLINSIKNSGGVTSIGTSFGITYVIEENTLKNNDGLGLVGLFAPNKGQIQKLGKINTPEAYAAAQVLMIDGSIGQAQDASNDVVRFNYSASAKKATTANDVSYWVIGIEVKVAAL